jgi:hypothetical protein
VKGITTLPKRKMFPASVLAPSESEIYSKLLEANASQGQRRSNPEHTQQALFAEKLRRDNYKKPEFHPHPTAHREGIAAHQELRNLRSVTDKLQEVLKGLSNAPQIQQTTIASIKDSMKDNLMKDIFLKRRNKNLVRTNVGLRTTIDNFQRAQRDGLDLGQDLGADTASLIPETIRQRSVFSPSVIPHREMMDRPARRRRHTSLQLTERSSSMRPSRDNSQHGSSQRGYHQAYTEGHTDTGEVNTKVKG